MSDKEWTRIFRGLLVAVGIIILATCWPGSAKADYVYVEIGAGFNDGNHWNDEEGVGAFLGGGYVWEHTSQYQTEVGCKHLSQWDRGWPHGGPTNESWVNFCGASAKILWR